MTSHCNRLLRCRVASILLVLCALCNTVTTSTVASGTHEYCNGGTASLRCLNNEVVLVQEAVYGRRRIGKCIPAQEVIQSMAGDPRYLGCTADVLDFVQSRCSGQRECEIRVNDRQLEQTKPCYTELKSYLEITYACIEVVESDRSCVVSVTSNPLHIAPGGGGGGGGGGDDDDHVDSWSTRQSNVGCGTKTQPWLLETPAGQRINISLLDFTSSAAAAAARMTSQHLSRSTSHRSSSSSVICEDEQKHQYGYIIDDQSSSSSSSSLKKKNVSVCEAGSNRQTHVYLSTSNHLQLVLPTQHNFLLRVEAVGCTNLVPPADAWIKREDDKIIIGCYTSRQTWQLRCVDDRWTGVLSNCTGNGYRMDHGIPDRPPPAVSVKRTATMTQHQLLVIVAVSFVGLSVCLIIIFCGIFCLRRYSSQYNRDHVFKDTVDKSRGMRDVTMMSAPVGSIVTSPGDRKYLVLKEDPGNLVFGRDE